MTSQFLVSFTTFFLENQNFLTSAGIVENGSLHYCTLYVWSAYLDSPVCIYQKHFVELDCSAFLRCKAVDENFHTSFNLELVSCNIYNCVHKNEKL